MALTGGEAAPVPASHAARWLVMLVLGLSGTVIYLLPFMREIYYEPLHRALGLNNTEIGTLMSAFGAASMLTYLPGGWLADRVSPRLLISLSLVSTGLLGFWFATFPGYWEALLIHALWGITVTGMMWGALIKATSDWGAAGEQGRAFGLLEAGRGVFEAGIYTLFLQVFAWAGGGSDALANVVIQYSILHIALGIIAWRVIAPGRPERQTVSAAGLATVLRMPAVWLIALVIMTAYCGYWGAYNFAAYAGDVFLMSAVTAGAIGAGKVWLKPIAAAVAGPLADRIGIWRAVAICMAILSLSYLGFALVPGGPGLVPVMIANIILASTMVYALRGIYFALLAESGVPAVAIGTATGLVSMIGFTPDIFMPVIGGALMDAYPGARGYQLYFGLISGLIAVGFVATLLIGRLKKKGLRRLGP